MDKPPPTGSGRRRTGRRLQESLVSNLGPVLDLSAGGMRVLSNRSQTGTMPIELSGQGGSTQVEGEVVWTRRLGFRRFEIGIHFTNVDEAMAEKLTRIASNHAVGCQWHDTA